MKHATFRIKPSSGFYAYLVQRKVLGFFWHTIRRTDVLSYAEEFIKNRAPTRYFDYEGKELK